MNLMAAAVRFLSWLEPKRGETILDIGCGEGAKIKRLRARGVNAFGLDVNKVALARARRDDVARLVVGDAIALPFKSAIFDKAICTEVLEHVANDGLLLVEAARVLKPVGFFYFSTPHKIRGFDFWDPAWLRWKIFDPSYNHRHYALPEIFKKCERAGFDIARATVLFGLPWLFVRWFNVFLKYVFRVEKQIEYTKTPRGNFDIVILAKKKKS